MKCAKSSVRLKSCSGFSVVLFLLLFEFGNALNLNLWASHRFGECCLAIPEQSTAEYAPEGEAHDKHCVRFFVG